MDAKICAETVFFSRKHFAAPVIQRAECSGKFDRDPSIRLMANAALCTNVRNAGCGCNMAEG
jgi:hypothetical protein